MLTQTVSETNRSAVQSLSGEEIPPGFIIAMSIHYLSSLTEFWKDYYVLGIPEFAKVMPRYRLLDIIIYLHLKDNF